MSIFSSSLIKQAIVFAANKIGIYYVRPWLPISILYPDPEFSLKDSKMVCHYSFVLLHFVQILLAIIQFYAIPTFLQPACFCFQGPRE